MEELRVRTLFTIKHVLVAEFTICRYDRWDSLLLTPITLWKLSGLLFMSIELGCICWQVTARATPEPLRIKISGAPASGKGTQCELITRKVSNFINKRASEIFYFSLGPH